MIVGHTILSFSSKIDCIRSRFWSHFNQSSPISRPDGTIMPYSSHRWFFTFILLLVGSTPMRAAEPLDFTRDVVPVLTKAGCNSGVCHGAFPGRGGFALSLLGFDPNADYATIVQASRGRRIDSATPDHSLLLRKASGGMSHGGGKRLDRESAGYQILRRFIDAGVHPPAALRVVELRVTPPNLTLRPGQNASLNVHARWSDGVERDVTDLALFDARDATITDVSRDGIVIAHRAGKSPISVRFMGYVASVDVVTPFGKIEPFPEFARHNFIDELVLAEWKRMGVKPSPLSTDAEFMRRVSFDIIGTLPTPDELRKFLASNDPDKRNKLIDELLERPEFADYWALKWGDLLRVHRRYVGDKGLSSFGGWLRRSIRENKPLDRMVRELLTSQGNLFNNGPVAYYFVDQKPEELAETTAQLFLGVRLQCARCHHHPFEVWGQEDYYGIAAFFTRLEVRENNDAGRFGGMRTLRPVSVETRTLQVPSKPKLLGARVIDPDAEADLRRPLAEWITKADNPFFARNLANRYWAYLTGRGLVEPIDDMRATNPASHPELLDMLSKELSSHGFDAKHLIRTICRSRVYQLTSGPDENASLFTHRVPRRLPAEVLLDAINQATGYDEAFAGCLPGTRAIALPDPTVPSTFLTTFGRPLRNNPCECNRDSSPDLLQALHLLNSTTLNTKIANPKGRIAGLMAKNLSDDAMCEELYVATLSRKPTDAERKIVRELLADAPTKKEVWEDVLWALLNSAEFSFNH